MVRKRILGLLAALAFALAACGVTATSPSPGTAEDIERGGTGSRGAVTAGEGAESGEETSAEDQTEADAGEGVEANEEGQSESDVVEGTATPAP